MGNGGRKRINLSIPAQDEQVLEWFALQSNMSVSIRRLVKSAIKRYGLVDMECIPVSEGRPRQDKPAKRWSDFLALDDAERRSCMGSADMPDDEKCVLKGGEDDG